MFFQPLSPRFFRLLPFSPSFFYTLAPSIRIFHPFLPASFFEISLWFCRGFLATLPTRPLFFPHFCPLPACSRCIQFFSLLLSALLVSFFFHFSPIFLCWFYFMSVFGTHTHTLSLSLSLAYFGLSLFIFALQGNTRFRQQRGNRTLKQAD